MSITTDARAALARLHAGEITHYLHDEIARLLADAVAEIDRLDGLMSTPPIDALVHPTETSDVHTDHEAP